MTATGQNSSREACSPTFHRRSHQIDLRRSIQLATWNVLTLPRTGYQEAITRELKRLGVDIACLTETGIVGSGRGIVEGHTFIYSGGTQNFRGLSLVIAPHVIKSLTSWVAVSDRLLTARFTHRHGDLTIIAVYAPTENATDAEKDEFYSSLETILVSVGPHDQLIIASDLNAVSGKDRTGFEQVVGPHGSGYPNDNTTRLLAFCSHVGISMAGSWFRRQDIWHWSWISNDGVTKKEINHMLTRNRKDFVSYRVYRRTESPANTDHSLTIARFKVNLISVRPRPTAEVRINTNALRNDVPLQLRYASGVLSALGTMGNLSMTSNSRTAQSVMASSVQPR